MHPMITRFLGVSLVALAVGPLTGCTASSEYMREAAAPKLEAPSDKATVVFIRPSGYAAGIGTTIIDEKGHFLGDALAETYFVTQVDPGKQMFIAWAENTAALTATLEAGKTYYVEVSSKMGAFSARMHLLALTPRSENWGELRTWLSESKFMQVDQRGGQAYLDERREDVMEKLADAKETLADYDAEELAERTLRAEDGQ
jgi:hypothetical protein